MSYKCLGNNWFEFNLQLYRDCNCTSCADFDPIVYLSLYRCGNVVNCNGLNQSDHWITLDLPLISRSTVSNPDIPGFQFPEQCLERGDYKFALALPLSNEIYYISYQRCCRPETVTNIINPRNVGMTIFTEIQLNAFEACNSSSIFQESISPVFCLGETMEIDHSALDPDGDSLVYSICSPFTGAGLGGGPDMPGGNTNACNGIIPIPSCPPPYNFVDYTSGFSGGNPLGPGSQFSINPTSGLITVKPTIAGHFLVAICVEEYRNGVLINTSSREFTYLAAACQTTYTRENLNPGSLKLFPNPANNFIHITIQHAGTASNQIHIFNSYGQCIEKLDLISNDQKLDISGWPEGLYNLILLEDGKVVQTEKLVKIEN